MLTGYFKRVEIIVDLNRVMRELNDTLKEEEVRQLAMAIRMSRGASVSG